MIDSKAVAVLWAYLEEFDRTGNAGYLVTAWSIFEGLIDDLKFLELRVIGSTYKVVNGMVQSIPCKVTGENLNRFVSWWVSSLLEWNAIPSSVQRTFILQLAKYNLIKLLTAIGAITNPFESATSELIESVEGATHF